MRIFILACLLPAACAAPDLPPAQRAAVCVDAFRAYDRKIALTEPLPLIDVPRAGSGTALVSSPLAEESRLRQAGCLGGGAVPADLTAFARPAAGRPAPRAYVHLGAVPSNAAEARVRAALKALGYPSVGKGYERLGRRIFAGPLATAEAQARAAAAGRAMGFSGIYLTPRIP